MYSVQKQLGVGGDQESPLFPYLIPWDGGRSSFHKLLNAFAMKERFSLCADEAILSGGKQDRIRRANGTSTTDPSLNQHTNQLLRTCKTYGQTHGKIQRKELKITIKRLLRNTIDWIMICLFLHFCKYIRRTRAEDRASINHHIHGIIKTKGHREVSNLSHPYSLIYLKSYF